jgi:hypothetical protein
MRGATTRDTILISDIKINRHDFNYKAWRIPPRGESAFVVT